MFFLRFSSTQVLIVDDGSTDRTSKVAFEFVKKYKIDNVRVILLGKNHGKGEAVRKVSYFCLNFSFVNEYNFAKCFVKENVYFR